MERPPDERTGRLHRDGPGLPGLATEGKDLNHARSMVEDAIQCYIEGLKKAKQHIPVERETAQVKISIVV